MKSFVIVLCKTAGNYYSHLVKNSSHAARLLSRNLQNAVSDASKLHSTFFGSDVPKTLQDMLINSLSHIRYVPMQEHITCSLDICYCSSLFFFFLQSDIIEV